MFCAVLAFIGSFNHIKKVLLKYRSSNLHLALLEYLIDYYCWLHVVSRWGYQLTTVQNGGPQAISEILHIEYWIVCCIKTYLIHIYHMSKCSKYN